MQDFIHRNFSFHTKNKDSERKRKSEREEKKIPLIIPLRPRAFRICDTALEGRQQGFVKGIAKPRVAGRKVAGWTVASLPPSVNHAVKSLVGLRDIFSSRPKEAAPLRIFIACTQIKKENECDVLETTKFRPIWRHAKTRGKGSKLIK